MTKTPYILFALLLVSAFLPTAVHADEMDRALLSTFCDAGNIQRATCKRAKFYPNAGRRGCDVKLTAGRYSGKFLASGNRLLVVSYESECEPHATDFGGAVLFEQVGGTYNFRGFQPGMQSTDCVTLARNERDDVLVCITGHMGQGVIETGVAQVVFTEGAGKRVTMSLDFLARAEDTIAAYGSNVVDCDAQAKYFGLDKLSAGPQRNTVALEVSYADADTIRTACGAGFPKPEETYGELAPGEAYVPEGYEKRGKLIIDLASRKVTMQ
jgi:hypothetical protein